MKIESKDLTLEVACAIKDLFEASVAVEEQEITLNFVNGQKFVLTVKEK